MSDEEIIACYPTPSIFFCESKLVIGYGLIVFALGLLLCYYAVLTLRNYLRSPDSTTRNVSSFFVMTAFSFSASSATLFLDPNVQKSNARYFYQTIPRLFFCLSQCMLSEQTITILVLLRVRYAKIMKWLVIIIHYFFILITIVFSFILVSYPYSIDSQEEKINITNNIILPVISTVYLLLQGISLIVNTLAFVFLPKISQMFQPSFIKKMKAILIFAAFFFITYTFVSAYQSVSVPFDRVFIIDYGFNIFIISMSIQNLLSDDLPKVVYTVLMWLMTNETQIKEDDKSKDEETPDRSNDKVIEQALVNLDDGYFFPT